MSPFLHKIYKYYTPNLQQRQQRKSPRLKPNVDSSAGRKPAPESIRGFTAEDILFPAANESRLARGLICYPRTFTARPGLDNIFPLLRVRACCLSLSVHWLALTFLCLMSCQKKQEQAPAGRREGDICKYGEMHSHSYSLQVSSNPPVSFCLFLCIRLGRIADFTLFPFFLDVHPLRDSRAPSDIPN